MSFTFKKYTALDLTVFTVEGDVDVLEWLRQVEEYNRSGATRLELYDLRMSGGEFNTESARNLHFVSNPQLSIRDEKARTAILVARPSTYGLARVYTAYAEADKVPWKVEIFYSIEEAGQWLGVDLTGIVTVPQPPRMGKS